MLTKMLNQSKLDYMSKIVLSLEDKIKGVESQKICHKSVISIVLLTLLRNGVVIVINSSIIEENSDKDESIISQNELIKAKNEEIIIKNLAIARKFPKIESVLTKEIPEFFSLESNLYLYKVMDFYKNYHNKIILSEEKTPLLFARLEQLKSY